MQRRMNHCFINEAMVENCAQACHSGLDTDRWEGEREESR